MKLGGVMTTAGTTDVQATDSLESRLTARALSTFERLAELGRADDARACELFDKFQPAISDIDQVRIAPLSDDEGSFVVRDRILYINEDPVARLLHAVTTEFERRSAANDSIPDPAELPTLLESVFTDFLLHELRHRTQGVETYDTVQRLKAVGGNSAMAELDVLADRDAAWAYAAINVGWGNRSEFLASFREALFLSSAYFFKIFPIPSGRHDKIERAIGVLLMAARLANLQFANTVVERSELPLDAPISIVLSSTRNSLAIYKGEPSKKLLGVANDADGVVQLVVDVGNGNFDSALVRSVKMMSRLNLLR